MLFRVHAAAVFGITAHPVAVEVDFSYGDKLNLIIVGLPDAAVRESGQRVKSALRNCGFMLPPQHVTINLAPADLRKEGSSFDLPMAVGVLGAAECLKGVDLAPFLFMGELALDGEIRPVKGALSAAVMARERGLRYLVLPEANAPEAAVVEGIQTIAVRNLLDTTEILTDRKPLTPFVVDRRKLLEERSAYNVDFRDVRGQYQARRALEVAAAGGHNIVMIGPPGSGKTMLARRLPTILPPMNFDEAIETTKIHSVAGLLGDRTGLVATRPFRAPHHTISDAGLIGGGVMPRPGEVSLAHNGVLFLDELPEFQRRVLDVLRQPLEDGEVTIARAATTLTFPANFMLAAAMNPCPCGHFGNPQRHCSCSPPLIQRYLGRISGPLLDRIDLHVQVPAVQYKELTTMEAAEDSVAIRARVIAARRTQQERLSGMGIYCNAGMTTAALRRFCQLDADSEKKMANAVGRLGLSARAYDRILRVARTLADLEQSERIASRHISEAIQYRTLDRNYWH